MDKKHKQPPQGQQPMYPNIPGLPPGMMPPNTGGKPMVVVVMKGGGQPNMGGLPFMMGGAPPPQQGGKKKKKKGSKGGKKKKKSGEKSKTKKSGEEESDSDSDRVNAPDIPAAHTHKPPPGSTSPNPQSNGHGGTGNNGGGNTGGGGHGGGGNEGGGGGGGGGHGGGGKKGGHNANPMASSFGSTSTDGGAPPSSSTTSTTSQAGAAGAAGAGGVAAGAAAGAVKKTPAKKPAVKKAPAKPGIKKEAFIIKDGNVDKSCVPAFVLVDGPAGCPVIVPIDARDENAIVNELGPQPLTVAPKETTRGYLVLNEEGLLHFKPEKECKGAPFASTPGQLQKFLVNSNIFIADVGPQLPDEKTYNKASTATKDKIGGKDLPVSGHVTMVTDKGTCKFSRVVITQTFPFYPPTAAFGVLVRDFTNGYVYFVPTENRFVGMVLSQGIKQPFKPVVEASIVGNIYKDANGAAVWGVPSDKQDNIMGFIMCSGTGVPIYVPKPDDVQRPATPVKKAPLKGAVTPGAVSVTGQTASPSPASAAGSTTNATGAVAGADGTASTTVPLAGAQGGETGGAAKPVDSVTCINAQQGGGGVTSMTVPIAATSDPAAAAAAGGEDMKDQLKKMVAAQQELPPPEPEPPAAAEAKEEEKKEEEEAPPPPPPPPKKPSQSQTNIEYKASNLSSKLNNNDIFKKFLDDRSSFL